MLASLIALFLAPPLWRKAVRITTKKLNQQSPRTMSEGQADRDQMRAEFAITTRKMETRLEQLKETSDARLIELSTTEKKRDRLHEKIKNLQTTVQGREEATEKLTKNNERLQSDIGDKNEQLATQAEHLKQQKKKLKAQAETLEANASKLDAYKQKNSDVPGKTFKLSTKLSKQNQKLKDLRQELGASSEHINRLIVEIGKKDEKINQLDLEIAATLSPAPTGPKPKPATANEINLEDSDNRISPANQARTHAPSLATTIIHSSRKNPASNRPQTPSGKTPCAGPKTRHPALFSKPSGEKLKPVEPQTPSLAERIRALQVDHTK